MQKKLYNTNAERQRAYRQRKSRNKIPLQLAGVDRTVLRHLGGKWKLSDWIQAYFPPHTVYCEPFGGGASVLLTKPPSKIEVYNDLNRELVNFFNVLRSRPQDLIQQIELTPYARYEWEIAQQPTDDPLEQARRLYILSWQTFKPYSGHDKYPSWRVQTKHQWGKTNTKEWSKLDHLYAIAARLKNVQIECRPANAVIDVFDASTTLFYVDPPYLPGTRPQRKTAQYRHELTVQEHYALAEQLNNLKGMVILSGYDSELYNELYPGWIKRQKTTTTSGNHTSTEYIWISPNTSALSRLPLFYSTTQP